MEKRNLIIGAFYNYQFSHLKSWVLSAKEVTNPDTTDIVLLATNTDEGTRESLVKNGVKVVDFHHSDQRIPIHVQRFLNIYDFLTSEGEGKYEYVVTTDVKDVIFQKDPFSFLHESLLSHEKNVLVSSEAMRYKDEPWGNDNLMGTFGPYIHEKFCENAIMNVGVIGGKTEYVKDLCLLINLMSINRPIPIVDQSTFNVLINTAFFKDHVAQVRQDYGWACHAGTTVDPSKIEAFRILLTEKEPYFLDGKVYTPNGEEFVIVHQYDRVPEWNSVYKAKYGIEDEPRYFTYRTV